MSNSFSLCAIIPVYRHGKTLAAVCTTLHEHKIPVIIVDDGNEAETKQDIRTVCELITGVDCISLPKNCGKGCAVIAGFQFCQEKGYTHALQVDADGQHDLSALTTFIQAARENHESIICGYPEYDASVPSSRKNGRKITTVWVSIETLSRDIVDAMCGFRIYPVEKTCALVNRSRIGKRMTFDIDILVRLHWSGLRFIFLPVKVRYPEDGISNFRMLQDNISITAMHTRLFFGMIIRLPIILYRKIANFFSQQDHGNKPCE